MLRHYLVIVVFLFIGILVGATLLSRPDHNETRVEHRSIAPAPILDHTSARPSDAGALATLRDQLQQERQARARLQTRLEALQTRVEELEYALDTPPVTATDTTGREQPTQTPQQVKTSVQALVEAGIGEDQAAWIQGRLDEIELQQLYLRDRATREGWLNEPRYHKERRQYLNAVTGLRKEIDDDAYDRMLYVLGRANRVVIRDTLRDSVADQYGLQSGDRVIEYDGQRVFTSNELSSLVTQGSSGVMTLVRVERGGEIQDIYLPRGPLGIRMTAARQAP